MKKEYFLIFGCIMLTLFSCMKTESPVALDTLDTTGTTNTLDTSDIPETPITGILPASSLGDWINAGVEGGIPVYSVGVDVIDYGATGDGTTDDTDAILDAIAACPADNAVFFPAGTYRTTRTLVISKSVVLRGAGPDLTLINHDHAGNAIRLESGGDRAGIEDLHVKTVHPLNNASGNKILLLGVTNSWVKNIESSGYVYRNIVIQSSSHCEVRDSYLHTTYEYVDWEVPEGDHGDAYGIVTVGSESACTYNLVENNILDWFRHAMILLEHCTNSVYAYNFSWTNWSHVQSETHCLKLHHPDYDDQSRVISYTLLEGNVFEMSDSHPWHHTNTYLRNRIMGGGMPGLVVQANNHAIGNELTEKKHSWSPNNTLNSKEGSLAHGNYVTDGSGMQWDPSIEDQNIPNSYYRTTKPEWFGDLEWPPFGGDLMPGNTRQIPAEVRYWAIQSRKKSPSNLKY